MAVPGSMTLSVGQTTGRSVVNVTTLDLDKPHTYSVSPSGIIDVSDEVSTSISRWYFYITGLKPGVATLTVKYYLKNSTTQTTDTLVVTVHDPDKPDPEPEEIPVSSISLSAVGDKDSLIAGYGTVIRATVSPSNATEDGVTWSVVSGAATLSSRTDSSCTATCTSTGTSVIKATAKDGSGITATISLTWVNHIETTSLVVSQSSVTVESGEYVTITVTKYPADSTQPIYTNSSSSDTFHASVRQDGAAVGTNVWTVMIYGDDPGTDTLVLTSGNATASVRVTVTEAKNYVTDIVFPSTSPPSVMDVGDHGSLYTAQARPISADDRRLTASIISGTSVVSVVALNTTSNGCTFSLTAESAGTATLRVSAMDGGGYYEDYFITVRDFEPATNLSLGAAQVYVGFEEDIAATGYGDEDVEWEIISGSSHVEIVTEYAHRMVVKGLSVGSFTVKATSDRTGTVATRTYTVSDEWPYNGTTRYEFTLDEAVPFTYLNPDWHQRRLHGGRQSVSLQDGLTLQSYSIFPPYDSSTIVQSGEPIFRGTPHAVGTVTIYASETSGVNPETQRILITVTAPGTYTKTVHFDANLPSGAYLTAPVPADLVKENTGDEWTFDLPYTEPAAPGYIFVGWWDPDDSTHPIHYPETGNESVTVTGQEVTRTLYAIWFPLVEGMEIVRTREQDRIQVRIQLRRGLAVDTEIPMTVWTEADAKPYTRVAYLNPDAPAGTHFVVDGTSYTEMPTSISQGEWSIVGTPSGTESEEYYAAYRDALNIRVGYTFAIGETEAGIVLNANGGAFANGATQLTIHPPDGTFRLPDWSVMDRPGYRLSHWLGSDRGRAEMGEEVFGNEVWTAQWVEDTRSYDTEYLPHASVRIYRSLTQYIDATYLQVHGGEVSVEIAENRPGSMTMTLINAYDEAGGNLVGECTLWNAGTAGPIRPGMYVRVDDIRADGSLVYVTDGYITTVTPDAETVAIEVGDWITFLGRQGTTLRRNYYGGEGSRTSGDFDAGYDPTGLYADVSGMPSSAIPDGNPLWKVLGSDVQSGSEQTVACYGGTSWCRTFVCSLEVECDEIRHIEMELGFASTSALTGTKSWGGMILLESGGNSASTGFYRSKSSAGTDWMDIDTDVPLRIVGGSLTVSVRLDSYEGDGVGYVYVRTGTRTDATCRRPETGAVLSNTCIAMTLSTYVYHDVDGYEAISGGKMRISSIDGVNDLSDSTLWTPAADRVRIAYITATGQSTVDVMEGIAWAMGIMPMPETSVLPSEKTPVAIFRTGGGYAQDYLQKLADIASSDGRMRAYKARGYTTPVLVPSARHRVEDANPTAIRYGGDTVQGASIPFVSFSPRMTLKSRPSLVTLRGTMSSKGSSESQAIQIAMEDTDSTDARYGVLVESVVADSSAASWSDAGNAAWGEVAQSELDQWEGTVVLPGILTDLLPASGPYAGSGVPVNITDSRNGLSGYQARVRQVKLDYNACTTTVTLSNYSMVYSSGIADTAALAITGADMASGDNSTTLFNAQYVRIKTDTNLGILDNGNVVKFERADGSQANMSLQTILELPNGRHVVIATAPPDGDGHCEDSEVYGVVALVVNSHRLSIRNSVRPDYYLGQTLIVNVDCP